MIKVKVLKECDCFIASKLSSYEEFDCDDKAYDYAKSLLDEMNKTFCSKHSFEILKLFDNYNITFKKPLDKPLKCCGSGCCF